MKYLHYEWLVMEAESGNSQAIVDVLLVISHYHEQKKVVPEPLAEWFAERAGALAKAHAAHTDTSKRQRAVSKALGLTPAAGRPKKNSWRNLQIAWEIYHIHKSKNVGLPKAMELYLDEHREFNESGATEYLRQIFNECREDVIADYEAWIEKLSINTPTH